MQETDNYDVYALRFSEMGMVLLGTAGLIGLFSVVFYNSIWPVIFLLAPAFLLGLYYYKKRGVRKRKKQLKKEFLSGITMLGDYMRSGRSIESGIGSSISELRNLFGEESDIVREWKRMDAGFRYNRTVESVFADFGERCHVEEISDFSEVLQVTKRSGGKISQVVSNTANILSEQLFTDEKIETLVAAKKLEQKIMDVMPIGILLYIRIASPELLSVMYTTVLGRIIMTVCLLVYVFAAVWAERITEIGM